jgi:inner membrane protein
MASLGHIAVGMAAARLYPTHRLPRRSWILAAALWSLLSLSPDADVVGLAFGVSYEDEWGHRGATHSLAFSLIVGAAVGMAAPLLRRPPVRTGVTASLVLASHAVLDTLTDGGLGCALLWPFNRTRYFAPWNPIPVAPIGLDYFSPYGLMVATTELVLFAPLVWFALSPPAVARRSRMRALVVVWLLFVWLIGSGDPVREQLLGFVLREDTEFVSGFSDRAFHAVKRGQSISAVRQRLGSPFGEFLFYEPAARNGCMSVLLKGDSVASAQSPEACGKLGIQRGAPRAEVGRVMGRPEGECWAYSRSRRGTYYRARGVCFENQIVVDVIRRWHKE